MAISDRITKYRKEKRLSQDELANLLGYKSRTTICKIEKGERPVPKNMIIQLSSILGVSPLDILGESVETLYDKQAKKAEKQESDIAVKGMYEPIYNHVKELLDRRAAIDEELEEINNFLNDMSTMITK